MTALFGSAATNASSGGILTNPVVILLLVVLAIYIFLKFCTWAKNFQLTAGLKKTIYILTGVGMIVFNYLYSKGNAMFAQGETSWAVGALIGSLLWVLIFSFALMAETKPETESK